MKKPIVIGSQSFLFKKDAISHYRTILNSYKVGESLNDADFDDLMDLLEYGDFFDDTDSDAEQSASGEGDSADESSPEENILIDDITVSRVQFNTKCFEVYYSDRTSQYISYLQIINRTKYSAADHFHRACRNVVQKDVREVKQKFFDDHSEKGHVKCQETGHLSKWEELVVDHRQPNTFSIIVDRFKEVRQIDPESVEFTVDEKNLLVFADGGLSEDFRNYHKSKANLRIVRKERNSSRSALARIKPTARDLKVS